MKTKYFILFSFFLFGLFFTQCKKYEDDDVFIQWKRPEKRLIKYGPWVFEKLTVDGVDKSDEFRLDSAYFEQIRFYKPEIEFGTSLSIVRPSGFHSEYGVFELQNNKSELLLSIANSYINHSDYHNYGPLFISVNTNWEIMRLSKKGMTLKTVYNSVEYILLLIPENQ